MNAPKFKVGDVVRVACICGDWDGWLAIPMDGMLGRQGAVTQVVEDAVDFEGSENWLFPFESLELVTSAENVNDVAVESDPTPVPEPYVPLTPTSALIDAATEYREASADVARLGDDEMRLSDELERVTGAWRRARDRASDAQALLLKLARGEA